ncbi:uridine kinase [Labedella endophytica]|uniref:Uridine kinase n=1 Tax=Labedella endophytica TaxID=1523160 RepID=A0A3S0VGD5_9MICO|nr:uridine kinase [Labedella endophytica]RUR01134.1 uridine kinase [Labedella endophytica]
MSADTPARLALLRELRDEILLHYSTGRPVVAVDGLDGAGTTVFADALAATFAERDHAVVRASIDDFHRPSAERYAVGRDSPEGFYRDSYDYQAFRDELITPFRRGGDESFRTAVFDVEEDRPVEGEPSIAPPDAVLIVDGIFLHRPELIGLWNYSINLEVPREVAAARVAERDGTDSDPDAPSNARYTQGQRLYVAEVRPRTRAVAIVDNADPGVPVRRFADSC